MRACGEMVVISYPGSSDVTGTAQSTDTLTHTLFVLFFSQHTIGKHCIYMEVTFKPVWNSHILVYIDIQRMLRLQAFSSLSPVMDNAHPWQKTEQRV